MRDEKGFTADFTITLGTHRSGAALYRSLIEEKCQVSLWSMQALINPNFPVVAAETTVDIVVVSMLELDLLRASLPPLIPFMLVQNKWGLKRARSRQLCSCVCHFSTNQTGQPGAAGEFFVASEPFVLTREGLPKIFSVIRDDRYPYPETDIGLWLIANGTFNAVDAEHPDRLFNASDEERDHSGRFAFVIPK